MSEIRDKKIETMRATYIPLKPPEVSTSSEELSERNQQEMLDPLNPLNPLDPNSPPTTQSQKRISLSPEVLAACLARYSRSNEGIESIIKKYADKSPAAIFKFVDYGHASIAGLTGAIAIAIDEISMILALKLFEAAQMADGQESSTRYITMGASVHTCLSAEEAAVPPQCAELYNRCLTIGLELYNKTSEGLENKVGANPKIAKIPEDTPPKIVQRMLKNYALDRTRYFLPASAKTNMALVMSARVWAELVKQIDSLPWKEAKELCSLLRLELQIAAPNLVRHSYPDQASLAQSSLTMEQWKKETKSLISKVEKPYGSLEQTDSPLVQVWLPHNPPWESIDEDRAIDNAFKGKENRYSIAGPWLKRLTVCCQWPAMALAEIRDLNRHRTGFRLTHLIPKGFYLPPETIDIIKELSLRESLDSFINTYDCLLKMVLEQPLNEATADSYPYTFFLGTQLPFEHTQQGDKFVYEVELRTGLGAHFKYAQHLADAAEKFTRACPKTGKYINIGTAEPE